MSIVTGIIKTVINVVGAKNVVKAATSKPVREVAKKVIKHEIKKKLK